MVTVPTRKEEGVSRKQEIMTQCRFNAYSALLMHWVMLSFSPALSQLFSVAVISSRGSCHKRSPQRAAVHSVAAPGDWSEKELMPKQSWAVAALIL